jgi:hypothetical protein
MNRQATKRHRRRRGAFLPLLLLVALGALALAGCGGSSGGGTATSAGATTSSGGTESGETGGESSKGGGPGNFEISEEAQKCLQEQGVELPEFKGGEGGPPSGGEPPAGGELPEGGEPPQGEKPEGGAPGFGGEQSEEMKEAFEACGVETPEPGQGQGGPNTNSAAFKKQVQKYVACVRENGYDLPSPNLSGEGPVFDESEVNQEDPEFKKASEKCQSLLAGPNGGGESSGAESGESEGESS